MQMDMLAVPSAPLRYSHVPLSIQPLRDPFLFDRVSQNQRIHIAGSRAPTVVFSCHSALNAVCDYPALDPSSVAILPNGFAIHG
jgi:hypothetical protein